MAWIGMLGWEGRFRKDLRSFQDTILERRNRRRVESGVRGGIGYLRMRAGT